MAKHPSIFRGVGITKTAGLYYSSGNYHGGEDWVVNGRAKTGSAYYNDVSWYYHAPTSGTVIVSKAQRDGNKYSGFGNYVVIKCDDNYWVLMAHMKSRFVSTGDRVQQGTVIGIGGNTGNTAWSGGKNEHGTEENNPGRHLHIEVADYTKQPKKSSYSFNDFRNHVITPSNYIDFSKTGGTSNAVSVSGQITNKSAASDWTRSVLGIK